MIATPNSSISPTRGGMTTRKAMSAPPTTKTVMEWPMPQSAPIHAARRMVRSRATIAVMATTWSASVACRSPSRNPSTAAESAESMNRSVRMCESGIKRRLRGAHALCRLP